MRKTLVMGALAAVVMALMGVPGTNTAHAAPQTWSIIVHFEYEDGFNYDYTLARDLPTSEMPKYLQDCGSSHWSPSVVRYRCYPVPE